MRSRRSSGSLRSSSSIHRHWQWEVVFPVWMLAVGCLWSGRALKRRRLHLADLARLAEANVNLVTRFMVRPDKRSWREIDPFTALAYQRLFDAVVNELAEEFPLNAYRLTSEQEKKLVAAARAAVHKEGEGELRRPGPPRHFDLDQCVNLYPVTVVALVLAFLNASAEERARDRSEWAVAMATRLDAAQVRDNLNPMVEGMFRRNPRRVATDISDDLTHAQEP